jgi:hypothetical protein
MSVMLKGQLALTQCLKGKMAKNLPTTKLSRGTQYKTLNIQWWAA